jgi:hypothetical protein
MVGDRESDHKSETISGVATVVMPLQTRLSFHFSGSFVGQRMVS